MAPAEDVATDPIHDFPKWPDGASSIAEYRVCFKYIIDIEYSII